MPRLQVKPPADDADDPSRGGRFILKQSKKTKRMAAANLEPTYEMLDELALVGIKLTDEGFLQPQTNKQPLHVRARREEQEQREATHSGVDQDGKIAIRIVGREEDFASPKKEQRPPAPNHALQKFNVVPSPAVFMQDDSSFVARSSSFRVEHEPSPVEESVEEPEPMPQRPHGTSRSIAESIARFRSMPPLSRAQREGREPLDESARAFPAGARSASGIGARRETQPFGQAEEKAARRTRQWKSKREEFEEKMLRERAERERADKEDEERARQRTQAEIRSKRVNNRLIEDPEKLSELKAQLSPKQLARVDGLARDLQPAAAKVAATGGFTQAQEWL